MRIRLSFLKSLWVPTLLISVVGCSSEPQATVETYEILDEVKTKHLVEKT